MGLSDSLARGIATAVDRLIEARFEPAQRAVDRIRDENPGASRDQIIDALIGKYRQELATAGAASGGVAAVPAFGTAIALSAAGVDLSWTYVRLGEMILSIGAAHGHDADSMEEKRAWILSVLGLATITADGLGDAAAHIGGKGGTKFVKFIPISWVRGANRALPGGRFFVKFGTQQGLVRLGTVVPFGIGAAIGSGGNAMLVQSVGNRARRFFDERFEQPVAT